MSNVLYTIGYERRTIADLLSILKEQKIGTVVDVRQYPNSRRRGFSKSALARVLNEAGIGYESVSALGSPVEIRKDYRTTGDAEEFFKRYELYLAGQAEALQHLLDMVNADTCCLLCYEREAERCHRRVVAEHIKELEGNGLRICHL